MIRVTTNSSLQMYKSNLMNTTNGLNNAMTKLMTQRNFNSYASNPAAATRAFKIHSSLNATRVQSTNNETVKNKFDTAYSTLNIVVGDIADSLGKIPALEGLNGPNETNVNELGGVLRSGAEAIVQSMNAQYDSKFLFAGTDSANPPFAIVEENGKSYVTYRGIKIDDPVSLKEEYRDADGNPIPRDPSDLNKGNMTNEEVLEMWSKEEQFVDIGLGFKTDENGNVIGSTAFNSAISGIDILGYGMDEDGDPKNMISIMLGLADIFESYNDETGSWANEGDYEKAEQLVDKMQASRDEVTKNWSELSAQTKFLNTNATQLKSQFDSLDTERSTIEDIDIVDAIMELSWAQTCYSAALQVGTNVIPQSLMDYLK